MVYFHLRKSTKCYAKGGVSKFGWIMGVGWTGKADERPIEMMRWSRILSP